MIHRGEFQLFPKLTRDFVAERLQPTWGDLAWALRNHWLDVEAVCSFAESLVAAEDVEANVEVSLVCMDRDPDALQKLVDRHEAGEGEPGHAVSRRWMKIAVAWVYEHRAMYDDPLFVVESIWEAFDHDPALDPLIRWMPALEGQPTGEEELMERWRRYVVGAPG